MTQTVRCKFTYQRRGSTVVSLCNEALLQTCWVHSPSVLSSNKVVDNMTVLLASLQPVGSSCVYRPIGL